MSNIVNFAIPTRLNEQIKKTVKQKGFANRAEFFRFAVLNYIHLIEKPVVGEEERFDYLTKTLGEELKNIYGRKAVPSLRQQLAGI